MGNLKNKIEIVDIKTIKTNEHNPRILKEDKFKKLVKSIKEFPEMLEIRPIVVNADGTVLGGNMRLQACIKAKLKEVPIIKVEHLTEEQQKEFVIKDNVGFGEWDWDILANEWDQEKLDDWGLEFPHWEEEVDIHDNKEDLAQQKLTDKFIIPPFSILDTRQGYWQERKKYWKELIQDNGESRFESMGKFNEDYKKDKDLKTGFKSIGQNVSILDPVLAEIVNKWFGFSNCNTFDCFAGDSVFGYVSSYLGNIFTGIELRKEQADLNNHRIKDFSSKYICDDGRNVLKHIKEDSQDLLFSCPPYFDLEVYSDLPNDASNQKDYKDFINILKNAFSDAVKCLKDNRFAVITVGDVRDKKGFYYRFVDDIKDIFKECGMFLYNDLILIEQIGTKAMTINKPMLYRKMGKVHQNVLVFYKGNPKEIKNIFPKIETTDEGANV